MKWKYKELKGKTITLRSKNRTYQFMCNGVERLGDFNLRLFGTGPEPDQIFLQYSRIEINGKEHGTAVKASKDSTTTYYRIETETDITDSEFWSEE